MLRPAGQLRLVKCKCVVGATLSIVFAVRNPNWVFFSYYIQTAVTVGLTVRRIANLLAWGDEAYDNVSTVLPQGWNTGLEMTIYVTHERSRLSPNMAGKNGSRPGNGDDDGKTSVVTKTRPKTKKPSLYKVLLLNDDFTPMEFVVLVLQRFFNKGQEDATRIMLHVHQKGVGICGVYTYEVAETKVTQVMDFSRQHGHPLQCTMEKE